MLRETERELQSIKRNKPISTRITAKPAVVRRGGATGRGRGGTTGRGGRGGGRGQSNGRGGGRGGPTRGGGAGRGGREGGKVSQDTLDSQLDSYMLKTKGGLDAQMDDYMSQTKVRAVTLTPVLRHVNEFYVITRVVQARKYNFEIG